MSKQSVRDNIEKLRQESKVFLNDKTLSPELKFFIKSIFSLIDIIVVILLEKKVRKNSSNSGLPPAQGFGSNGNRNKSNNGDEGKKGSRLPNSRTKKKKVNLSPSECSNCNADLIDAEVTKSEERKKIDIIYEVEETTFTSDTKKCPNCGEKNKVEFPEGIDGKIQYGNGIKAAIINFLAIQMMSLERVQEHFKGLIGKFISQATMLKYIAQFSASLESWENQMREELLQSKVIHVDETSMRVNGTNHWIHTYSAGDIVLQFIHPSRGLEATEDIGILPKYGGTIVHDCWSTYFAYEDLEHALCGGHLLRELKFVEQSTGHKWATKMKELLTRAIGQVNKSPDSVLISAGYTRLQNNYRCILFEALDEMPGFPKPNGQRGRLKHTDEQNLWTRLMDYESAILMFARVPEVDATNNRAERDLRITKLKKKVSGCFRTVEFAKHFCRILSYVKTMRNKGYSSLDAITRALNGTIPS